MEIYISCLAAYNNGKLHGEWVKATQGIDHIQEAIKRVLETSPENNKPYPCEEWAIHDYNDFPSHVINKLGENPSLDELTEVVDFILEHQELGEAVLGEYDLEDAKRMIDDCYHGEHKNEEDFIYSFYEDCGMLPDPKHNPLMHYINWEEVARDAFINDFISIDAPSGIYVFGNN